MKAYFCIFVVTIVVVVVVVVVVNDDDDDDDFVVVVAAAAVVVVVCSYMLHLASFEIQGEKQATFNENFNLFSLFY